MDIDNINIEIETFLEKFSRFLSKDIYISVKMYDKFLDKYDYLYRECLNSIDYYKENINYLKILKIRDRKLKFIKAHNKKYIRDRLIKDKDYFDSLYENISLSLNDREVMLIMDNLTIDSKNIYQKVMLIISKIRYLLDRENYRDKDIGIIVGNKKMFNDLERLLKEYKLDIKVYLYKDILDRYCNDNEVKLISDKEKFKILESYFKKDIFSNKGLLREYITNYKYLFFNKDVYEYDTLNDYHNYIMSRKYIQSGSSRKDYITSLIEKKRDKLITINNEKVKYKEEVDIANYLYLNNIRYKIINGDRVYFKINKILFYYVDIEEEQDTDNSYFKLYSKYKNGTLLSHLKKLLRSNNVNGFVMDKDVLKNKIKMDSRDIYYREFIDRIVIPYIDNDYSNDMLLDVIKKYYLDYIDNNRLIDNKMIKDKIRGIRDYNPKYLIMDSDYVDNSSIKLIVNGN